MMDFHPVRSRSWRWLSAGCLAVFGPLPFATAAGPVTNLPEVTVSAERIPEEAAAFSTVRISEDRLRRAPQWRLDDVLRQEVAGFSLFRRSSSRIANPTAQGVTLRNVGPNGAGRTLVLLDGIPLNDPFAGWVSWSRVPVAGMQEVVVSSGGGAGLFGNAALGGTIHLRSTQTTRAKREIDSHARMVLAAGDHGTWEASLDAGWQAGPVRLSAWANRFSTDGYPVLQSDQRGPVDTDADASSWLGQLGAEWAVNDRTTLSLSGGAWEEKRNNGTELTNNSTQGQDFSATLRHLVPEWDAELRVQGYLQRRRFTSTFSSVNAERTEEVPALDQYDVPANAAGGSVVWSQRIAERHQVVAGVDWRWVEGETNEEYFRVGDSFTRTRHAGGQQFFAGVFAEENWRPTEALLFTLGGRLDFWRQMNGARIEVDQASGERLREETFPDQEGFAPNGRLGFSAQLTRTLRLHGAGYTGFRVATLNELYRPFRVGNDITEANAELDPERLAGVELGTEWRPSEAMRLSVTGFYQELHDAIGNVTIGRGPGVFPQAGFVPDGAILRQRENIDRVEVLGLEAKWEWQLAKDWRFQAACLLTDARVSASSQAPALEGKHPAQAPGQVLTASLEWSPGAWEVIGQVRYIGEQYEDDLNTLALADSVTVDLAVGYHFGERASAWVKVENLLDAETEVGKTGNGLISIGAPRLWSVQVEMRF